jgi:hypothetical protein
MKGYSGAVDREYDLAEHVAFRKALMRFPALASG